MTTAETLQAPTLTPEQICEELKQLHAQPHRSYRSAVYAQLGASADPLPPVELGGTKVKYRAVTAASELELRKKLAMEGIGTPVVYLVPFARQLPRDLESLFASGRVWLPKIESLLPQRFGAKDATPRLLHSKLRLVAQSEPSERYGKPPMLPQIDLDQAWLVFLRHKLRSSFRDLVPISPEISLETEVQFFAATLVTRPEQTKPLRALVAQVDGAREELADVLCRQMGPSAPLILTASLSGNTIELAALAVVGEATRTVLANPEDPAFTLLTTVIDMRVSQQEDNPLKAVRKNGNGNDRNAAIAKALVDLSYLVPLVWPKLDDALQRAILGVAEGMLVNEQLRQLALTSHRLPYVFAARQSALAQTFDKVHVGSAESFAAVDEAARLLLSHERVDGTLAAQVSMGVRLAAFILSPIPAVQASPQAEIVLLANFQATAGGFVDWARHVVRSDGTTALGKSLHQLAGRVDEVRDALDRRFAKAYATAIGKTGDRTVLRGRGVGAYRPAISLIEDVVSDVCLELLTKHSDLKLLVLCMDGMSWANLAELWSPASISAFGGSTKPATSLVPVRTAATVAHIPTITKLSRSALFAGHTMAMGESLDTSRDDHRLANHPISHVGPLAERSVVLLRGDVLASGGGLSDDARKMVLGDRRIVAVVVNAIDDQLGGSSQLKVALSIETIPALRPLFEAAETTGRLVLLVSDHGNIRSDRFYGVPVGNTNKELDGAKHGARYRFLAQSEQATSDEIELPAGALALPQTNRLAVAVKETLRYSQLLHAGEHGGASLAEAIAPAVLLAPRGKLAAYGLEEQGLEAPEFWDRAVGGTTSEQQPAKQPQPQPIADLPQVAPKPQGELFQDARESALGEPELFKSKLFVNQLRSISDETVRPKVREAIKILLSQGGRMGREAFATRVGLGAGFRVPGFLVHLERVLNVDQELVVGMEGQMIVLDERLLQSIFLEESRARA